MNQSSFLDADRLPAGAVDNPPEIGYNTSCRSDADLCDTGTKKPVAGPLHESADTDRAVQFRKDDVPA